MDRLICGDVGFGKTEVAIRAAFKAVQDGRQVAVLVPTTVLAQQHLNTFRERMAGYPVAIEMLSRFRSRPEQRRILAAVARGEIDILIGTHRLLQRDVVFQGPRFRGHRRGAALRREAQGGVQADARDVDVLSMSATPIPRTLYLALTGARDLSVIETPPADRHPIQTIVKTYDEKVVVDAIRHEIRRGGQVFYLHNRVRDDRPGGAAPARAAARPQHRRRPRPDGRATELERVMTDFVAGRYQVLVCTTIIESGLDIPNCNTIIIEGADRFGLAQLYQLRGRVGRFKHQAYAYLLLHRHTRLLDVARQRLNALRQHNQLGAGFRIAMRDLELRGAGNLLGAGAERPHRRASASSSIASSCASSVARLKGDQTAAAIRASVKLDFVFVGEGEPAEDRPPAATRTATPSCKDAEDSAAGEMPPRSRRASRSATSARPACASIFTAASRWSGTSPASAQIEAELRDRFGKFGDEVRALLLVTEIRLRAEQKRHFDRRNGGNRLKCLRERGARRDDWVMPGTRFPSLTAPRPLLRLREIIAFLNNLPNP